MSTSTPGRVLAIQILANVDEEMEQAIADKTFPTRFPQWIEKLKSLEPLFTGNELQHLLETIDVVERVAATHTLINRIFDPQKPN